MTKINPFFAETVSLHDVEVIVVEEDGGSPADVVFTQLNEGRNAVLPGLPRPLEKLSYQNTHV